jgi:hypothetical protein
MQGTLLLDVVIRKCASILKLLPSKNQTLLIRWNPLLVLNLALDIVNGIRRFDLQGNCLARQRLDENLHATTEAEDEVESRFLLDIVIREGATVLELLSSKDETLLIRGYSLLVLDFGFDVIDRIRRFDFESDGFASEGLDKDLHTTTETEDEMEGGFLLNVVVRERAAVLELLSGKDKTLLVGRDALLVLDFRLDIVDGVGGLDFKRDGLASEGFDKDLHSAAEPEDEVQSGLLLDVVVGEGAAVFKLFASKDEALLIGRDAFLVLNLGLDVVDGVGGLNFKRDGYESAHIQKRESKKAESGGWATYSCQ